MAIIEVKHVSKNFGEKVALDDVTLDIPEGKIFGLLGPNGAGKSTLIRIINRILRYHALIQAGQGGDGAAKAKVLGVNPYFFKEYDAAVKKYSLKQTMRVISLLNDYDFKGKGGEVGEATPADLLVELTTKILNI